MTFIDQKFPVTISYGAQGGPVFSTSIISMRSGQDKRNIDWSYPRHEYDASTGVKQMSNLEDLIAFFHVVAGRGYSFRWKDWADYKSCKVGGTPSVTDQSLGTGDGTTVEFQLKKYYSFGGSQRYRNIYLPVSGTVLVAVDGVSTTAFSVNTTTGIITFDSAPALNEALTAGFEFDVHARMDTDQLSTDLTTYQVGEAEVPVIEDKRTPS